MAGRGRPKKKVTTDTITPVVTDNKVIIDDRVPIPKDPFVEAAARGESWHFASKALGYAFRIGNDILNFTNCHFHTPDPAVARAMYERYEAWQKVGVPPRFAPVNTKPPKTTPNVTHETLSTANMTPRPDTPPPEGVSDSPDPDDYVDKENPDDAMFGE